MIIHRTYSEEGNEIVHIPCVSGGRYYRIAWGGGGLYRNHLSVKGLARSGRKVKVIPKETNAHN